MIEVTDEMVAAYAKAFNVARATPRREGYAELDGIAAVLAIVERDQGDPTDLCRCWADNKLRRPVGPS